MEHKIKEWYVKTYATDTLGKELNEDRTFQDLFNELDNHFKTTGNVYNLLGVGDSLVRERVFEKLAKIMHCDYDTIYTQWLIATTPSPYSRKGN